MSANPADLADYSSRVIRELKARFKAAEPKPLPDLPVSAPMLAPAIETLSAPVGYFAGHETYADYRQSPWWARVREDALHRAHRRCQLCAELRHLEVHHNTYDRLGREWPSDVIVLCRACHAKHHDKLPEASL